MLWAPLMPLGLLLYLMPVPVVTNNVSCAPPHLVPIEAESLPHDLPPSKPTAISTLQVGHDRAGPSGCQCTVAISILLFSTPQHPTTAIRTPSFIFGGFFGGVPLAW